jgi:hypothetical protein
MAVSHVTLDRWIQTVDSGDHCAITLSYSSRDGIDTLQRRQTLTLIFLNAYS